MSLYRSAEEDSRPQALAWPKRVLGRLRRIGKNPYIEPLSPSLPLPTQPVLLSLPSLPTSLSPPRTVFGLLPTELLLLISSFLPSSGKLSLSYTCRRFHSIFTILVEDLFERWPSPSESKSRRHDQDLYKSIVRATHSSNRPQSSENVSPQRPNCRLCSEENLCSDFSITALRRRDNQQVCIKHEGLLWVCPSNSWNYEQASALGQDLASLGPRLKAQARPFPGGIGLCPCKQHFTTVHNSTIIQAFPIKRFASQAMMPTPTMVAQLLEDVHLRICPHRSMSSPQIPKCFRPNCIRTFDMDKSQCPCLCCRNWLKFKWKYCYPCFTEVQFRR